MNMIHDRFTIFISLRQIKKKYQSGVFYMGVKLYNSLPSYIKKESNNIIKFWISLAEVFTWQYFLFTRWILQFYIRICLQIILSLFIHIVLIYKQRFFTAIGLYFYNFCYVVLVVLTIKQYFPLNLIFVHNAVSYFKNVVCINELTFWRLYILLV